MKKGDLARIKDDAFLYHDDSLSSYTLGGGGDVVVVVVPNRVGGCGLFAQVLHPKLGCSYIRKERLEVIDTSSTLCPAMQPTAGCGITPPGGGHESR